MPVHQGFVSILVQDDAKNYPPSRSTVWYMTHSELPPTRVGSQRMLISVSLGRGRF